MLDPKKIITLGIAWIDTLKMCQTKQSYKSKLSYTKGIRLTIGCAHLRL